MNAEPLRLLQVYRALSGQWSGRMIEEGEEVAGIAGCESADDVEREDRPHAGLRADGEPTPGYTLDRVLAALEGKFRPRDLSAEDTDALPRVLDTRSEEEEGFWKALRARRQAQMDEGRSEGV